MQIKESISCGTSNWCFVDQCFGHGMQRQGQSQYDVMPCSPTRTHSLLSGSNPELVGPAQVSAAHPLLQPGFQCGRSVKVLFLLDRLELRQRLESLGPGFVPVEHETQKGLGGGWPSRAEDSCLAVEDLPKNQQDLINNLLWKYNWHYHSATCVHAEFICVGMLQYKTFCNSYYRLVPYVELPFWKEIEIKKKRTIIFVIWKLAVYCRKAPYSGTVSPRGSFSVRCLMPLTAAYVPLEVHRPWAFKGQTSCYFLPFPSFYLGIFCE